MTNIYSLEERHADKYNSYLVKPPQMSSTECGDCPLILSWEYQTVKVSQMTVGPSTNGVRLQDFANNITTAQSPYPSFDQGASSQ